MQSGILRIWVAAGVQLLGDVSHKYGISRFYIEFGNVPDANDVVTTPDFDVDDGIEYYVGLSEDPCCDFVREPVAYIEKFVSNSSLFSLPHALKAYAQTTAVEGIHGKPFTSLAISKITGGALVAAPDPNDYTKDILISRWYYDSNKQVVRPDGQPFAATRTLILGENP